MNAIYLHPDRDWTIDFDLENGNYLNECMFCKLPFMGHKRRVVCRKCDNSEPVNSSMSEKEGETENSTLPKELQPDPLAVEGSQVEGVREPTPVADMMEIQEQLSITWLLNTIRLLTEYAHGIYNGKRDDLTAKTLRNAFDQLAEVVNKSEPVVSHDQEEQEELWMEVFAFRYFRWEYFIEKMREQFTISRKPID